MNDQKNGKKNEWYLVYLNGKAIPVSKEVYEVYYQDIWRTYKEMRKYGRCAQNRWQCCSGDCGNCGYQLEGISVSLDYLRENAGFEIGAFNNNPADIVEQKMFLEKALVVADQLVPDGKRILALVLEGKPDRDIADVLGVPRSTCSERKLKLFHGLEKNF